MVEYIVMFVNVLFLTLCIFFPLFYFLLATSLSFCCDSCKQQIIGLKKKILSDNIFLLPGAFEPFTFIVITDILELMPPISFYAFCFFFSSVCLAIFWIIFSYFTFPPSFRLKVICPVSISLVVTLEITSTHLIYQILKVRNNFTFLTHNTGISEHFISFSLSWLACCCGIF